MECAEALGFGDASDFCGGRIRNDFSDEWVEVFFLRGEMFAEEIAREFDRDETMFLVGEADGFKAGGGIGLVIVNERARCDFDFFFAVADGGFAIKIQADFNAVWMEGARPIEIMRGMEFVPFKAEAEFGEVAEHLAPAGADGAPGGFFGERTRGGERGFAGDFHCAAESSAVPSGLDNLAIGSRR